ncbi:uncharacterized protein LOC117175629 [Belonocnema kinseyi]|uniref:uncharacterized protein LOC117175629 n=1 Tax=Belonocnema kinseyi TaxID=2817044 RepID=UPI00143DE1EF|nr:uncharacterized protein LOC117175629 [Belonocnema kinseyi]
MCDVKQRFTLVDVGANGRQSGGGIFKKFNMGKALASQTLNFPPLRPLYKGLNILKPFPECEELSIPEAIFNCHLRRARKSIECAFGRLASKWRILRRPISERVSKIVEVALEAIYLRN